jgi:O-succinylbenzoic acid--CoA ligase
MMLADPLETARAARPDHIGLQTSRGAWTWAELDERVAARAGGWRRAVTLRDRVALAGDFDDEWVVSLFALLRVGACVAPMPARATTEELTRACAIVEATAIVGPDDVAGRSALRVLRVNDTAGAARVSRAWSSTRPRLVIRTSGTTGEASAVPLTLQQVAMSAFASAARLGLHLDDRWLACLPLDHIGGLSVVLRGWLYATTTVLHGAFDAARADAALQSDGITLASVTPTMVQALLSLRADYRFPTSLRALLVGGASTLPDLEARLVAAGARVAVTWGMTEAASQVATRWAGEPNASGVGAPVLFTRVETSPEGRLVVSGPTVVGGRVETRDVGHVDARGQVHVRGRADDVVVSGGAKIDPLEVEAVLSGVHGVHDVAVVGVPDAQWGERVVAVVVGPMVAPDALSAACRARLSPHKVPKEWLWRDALPRTSLGKLDRRALRRELEEGR